MTSPRVFRLKTPAPQTAGSLEGNNSGYQTAAEAENAWKAANTYTVKVNSGEMKLYSVKFDVNDTNLKSKKYIRLKNIDTENHEALQPEYFEKVILV